MVRNSPQRSAGSSSREKTPEMLFEVDPLPEPVVTTIAEEQHEKVVRAVDVREEKPDWDVDETMYAPYTGMYNPQKRRR